MYFLNGKININRLLHIFTHTKKNIPTKHQVHLTCGPCPHIKPHTYVHIHTRTYESDEKLNGKQTDTLNRSEREHIEDI